MYCADSSMHQEIVSLIATRKTLILATRSPHDEFPEASYTPFIDHQERFYILVSQLAKHTQHLADSRLCHVLFLEDESTAANVFARKRVSFRCVVHRVDRPTDRAELLLDQMQQKFGPTIGVLRSLGDFLLLELAPREGLFVRGFGQAFPITPTIQNA
jgi:putative heme iron utilization protein